MYAAGRGGGPGAGILLVCSQSQKKKKKYKTGFIVKVIHELNTTANSDFQAKRGLYYVMGGVKGSQSKSAEDNGPQNFPSPE